MKILSWNCCLPPWSFTRRQRLSFIASAILKENPDLVCLQEVFFESDAYYLIKKFIQKGFKYSFRYQDLLTISKNPILFSHGTKFKDQGKMLSFSILDVLYGKAFQIVGIQIEDHKMFLANTHLLSAYALSGRRYQDTRLNQVKEILKYLKTAADKDIVLVGDFNFEPETESYKTIKKLGYVDLSHQILKTTTKKIDFIFAKNLPSEEVKVRSKFTELSDHAFLTLELKIRG